MEFLWVDLCFLLSPFTAPTEGKWPKKVSLSWFDSRQHTSGRAPMQMEWQGLSSGGTTLDGQSTAKNIQVGLRDTVTWEGSRRAHFLHCCVPQQVRFRHIIYKYIHLYCVCINVDVNLYLEAWANATWNSALCKYVSNPLFFNQMSNLLLKTEAWFAWKVLFSLQLHQVAFP